MGDLRKLTLRRKEFWRSPLIHLIQQKASDMINSSTSESGNPDFEGRIRNIGGNFSEVKWCEINNGRKLRLGGKSGENDT
jgi:hypothetical protein